jgi:hypothetical protein
MMNWKEVVVSDRVLSWPLHGGTEKSREPHSGYVVSQWSTPPPE